MYDKESKSWENDSTSLESLVSNANAMLDQLTSFGRFRLFNDSGAMPRCVRICRLIKRSPAGPIYSSQTLTVSSYRVVDGVGIVVIPPQSV